MSGPQLIELRFDLDARIRNAALEKGYDAVLLMTPVKFAEYQRSGKSRAA